MCFTISFVQFFPVQIYANHEFGNIRNLYHSTLLSFVMRWGRGNSVAGDVSRYYTVVIGNW